MPEAHESAGKSAINDEMLLELRDQASVLNAIDQAEDIALDLHERPFSSETRQRVLRWLESDTYQVASRHVHSIRDTATPGAN